MWRKLSRSVLVLTIFLLPFSSFAQGFHGFDKPSLSAVTRASGEWGLKIIVLNVGQADAVLLITPNGDVALIDSGKTSTAGKQIADYLASKTLNDVGSLKTIDLLYTTHYDSDHIGGLTALANKGVHIRKAFDQGLSLKRHTSSTYLDYTGTVGDPNDNLKRDAQESHFVRHVIAYGQIEHMGLEDQVEIKCVSVRGDTEGTTYDLGLDPSKEDIDENPGSIALLVRLGDFEFYTAGDQTDNDWKSKPDTEERLLNSGAIPGGNDIDVLKVSHHGSDTSTSKALVVKMAPEVAMISAKYTKGDKLPKKITLKTLQENQSYVLITGDGLDLETQDYSDALVPEDDGFRVSDEAVFNDQGNIVILVSADGEKYTVLGGSFSKTFDSKDSANIR